MSSDPSSPETAPASLGPAQQLLDSAYAHDEQGLFEQALQACEAALQIDPRRAEAHNLRGLLLDELGRQEDAIAAFELALRLDPVFDDAAQNLAEVRREWAWARPQARGSSLPETASGQGDLITIGRFGFPLEAHLARTRLEWAGIPAFVADDRIVTANWLYAHAIGGVRLRVRECDVEAAAQVFAQTPVDAGEDPEGGADDPRCPWCHSPRVYYNKRPAYRLVFASWLLFQLFFLLPPILFYVAFFLAPLLQIVPLFLRSRWQCYRCGHTWSAVPDEETAWFEEEEA